MSENERPPRDEILRGCIEQSNAEAEKEYKDLRKITDGISKKRLTELCEKEREEREEKVLNAMADILRFIATNGKRKAFYIIRSNNVERDCVLTSLVIATLQFIKKELTVKTSDDWCDWCDNPAFSAEDYEDISGVPLNGVCYPLWKWTDDDIAAFLKKQKTKIQ